MGKVNSMVEQNGVVYYLEEASTKVIEKYDEHLKACVKDSEYNFVRGYFGEVRELDLSWISLQDVVDLKYIVEPDMCYQFHNMDGTFEYSM